MCIRYGCICGHVPYLMYDVWCARCCDLCGLCVNIVLSSMSIVAGCITLGQNNKSSAGCISPKVLEHDEEHKKVH